MVREIELTLPPRPVVYTAVLIGGTLRSSRDFFLSGPLLGLIFPAPPRPFGSY